MPYTLGRPSPGPGPPAFVVKNGSKALARTSGVIPAPVSATDSITSGPAPAPPPPALSAPLPSSESSGPSPLRAWVTLRVSIVIRPPPDIASRALSTRFTIACSSWPGSALTAWSPAPKTTWSWTSSPISRRSMLSTELTRALRSSTLGRLLDLADHRAQVLVGQHVALEEVHPAQDDGEHVVEVVGDAAREPADRLHPLGLAEPALQRAALGHVLGDHLELGGVALGVQDRPAAEVDGDEPAIPPAPAEIGALRHAARLPA